MKHHHLSGLIHLRAKALGDKEALKVRNNKTNKWDSISWNTFSEKIMLTAQSLCSWGINEASKIGVYSQNMAECFYVDFGAFANRAIVAPMYATASVSQITYIIDEAEISILFVGEQAQYNHAFEVLKGSKTLKQLVIFDEGVKKDTNDSTSVYFGEFINPKKISPNAKSTVEKRMKEVKDDDIVHIIYTSGTTGEPKGVVLTHSNYMEAIKIHDLRLNYLPKQFVSMCFLPLTHIFEKAWSVYCLHKTCTLAINRDPRDIQEAIKEVRPQAMCCVPRFWEKVYAGVQSKIEKSGAITKKIFRDALETGRIHNLEYRNKNKRAPWWIDTKFKFYEKTIYRMLKKAVGIENGIIFPCAGAALSDSINTFIQSANIPLVYGYGLTETTATVSCFPKTKFEMGTVGKVMPEVEVKIGANNEILVKGGTVMSGYYKKPQATADSFTEDGWLKTGDAGYLTENNGIVLTDRIKDLYKTSNGKYIAPQQIEIQLSEDRYIDMVAVIGDQRKFVSALIVPDFEELKAYAKEHGIEYVNMEDLCKNPLIYQLFESHIKELQREFASYEQIKRFCILPNPFTIDSGELTNTLKVKRSFVAEKYKACIDKMYEE